MVSLFFFRPSKGEQMIQEYKGNSNKSKEEPETEKVVTPVVKGKVTVKKEPLGRKFSDIFLADTFENVKSYVVFDVLVPALKDLFVDIVNNGTNMLVNGRSGGRTGRNSRGGIRAGNVSYSSYYRGSDRDSRRDEPKRNNRERYSYSDIIFDTRGDATEVLDCMNDILDKFKMVSVSDFYELSHAEECERWTDRDYGWFDLDNATILRDRDGYKISLPKPEYLK